jgi:hypothetical protein
MSTQPSLETCFPDENRIGQGEAVEMAQGRFVHSSRFCVFLLLKSPQNYRTAYIFRSSDGFL